MLALLSKLALASSLSASLVHAYTVPLNSVDVSEQACSGMWGSKKGGKEAVIELSFTQGEGQVALVVYEWSDVGYLGVENPSLITGDPADYYYVPKTYICTTDALRHSLCTPAELGEFIVRFPNVTEDGTPTPPNMTVADTSIFTQGLRFVEPSRRLERVIARQAESNGTVTGTATAPIASSTTGTLTPAEETAVQDKEKKVATYSPGQSSPIRYEVERTGYYCVGVIPVTLLPSSSSTSPAVPAEHASFVGEARFINIFDGELPAGDHPKILWYLFLTFLYVAVAGAWAALCFRYRSELLPTQWYIGFTLAYLAVEMFVTFVYYRYLNAHGNSAGSTAFLVVVSILNAGRNSSSFFLLLVVAMGLSVVTPTLGSVMRKIQLLTVAHFLFGVVYSLGTVSVKLETASLIGLLAIVMGLSVTLTTFLMWTAVSLNGTILHLEKRKQHSKLKMFKNLHRILMGAVCAIGGFFVLSAIALSDRGSDDFAPRNWQYRWYLLDGSLSTIYACVFFGIAWLWRPTGRNVRFAMSEELAQDEDEADAEDYELAQAHSGARDSEDDLEAARPGLSQPNPSAAPPGYDVPSSRAREANFARRQQVPQDEVVFAIDDGESDDDDDEVEADKKRRFRDRQAADEEEEGDMGRHDSDEGEALVGGGSRSSRRG